MRAMKSKKIAPRKSDHGKSTKSNPKRKKPLAKSKKSK